MADTKGEWRAVYHGWVDDGSKPIWFVETADDVVCEVHDKANAQLIASAPRLNKENKELKEINKDLREACKATYAWYYEGQAGDYKVIGEYLRRALAKKVGLQEEMK